MQSRTQLDAKGAATANTLRTVIAAMFVLGITSLVWLHTAPADVHKDAAPVATPQSFLHAPSGDPSLPSLEATFARMPASPEEPPAPTF
jgi:hypothetical protein